MSTLRHAVCMLSCRLHAYIVLCNYTMNIDVSNPKYTLDEIAAQCKAAITHNKLRGKVAPSRTQQYQYKNWCE